MSKALNPENPGINHSLMKCLGVIRTALAYIFVWSCLVKLPATALRDWVPESWEPVLSYAAAHHLQWGRDIIFTYGPLGFLTTDFYWGNFFWPILLWAGTFALALTAALVPLLGRLPRALRLAFYVGLPLLTVPTWLDLGFDAIRILSIAVLGISCLPSEHPRPLRLIITALVLTILSLTKFTYCAYFGYTFIIIAASNRSASWRNTAILGGSSFLSFLAIYWWSGQNIANIFPHVIRSTQMAAGYSAAMGLPASGFDLMIGVALLISLAGLMLVSWFGCPNWIARTDRVALVAAGIFLAWKEGFARAELHVMVFFVYVFFLGALLPTLLKFEWPAQTGRIDGAQRNPGHAAMSVAPSLFARRVRALSTACVVLSLAPLLWYHEEFKAAIHNGLLPRNRNTLTAFLRPATYKLQLEQYLEIMRHEAAMPEICAIVERRTIGAMNLDEETVILNGLNYVPNPVFENYAAYTPELQRLNCRFYDSQNAPEYLLWHTGAIDGRFPTLDGGEVLLKILKNYSPVTQEKGVILWKKNSANENTYCLSNEKESYASLDQWVAIPSEPTWLKIECRQTLVGAMQGFLYSPTELKLEVQLSSGETRSYRLLPGNARSGFVISPFLRADYQLIEAAKLSGQFQAEPMALPKTFRGVSPRIVALKVHAANQFAYKHSIRFVMQTIHGIWATRPNSPVPESNEVSRTD